MKKYTSLLLVTAMMLSCASCSESAESEDISGTSAVKTSAESDDVTQSTSTSEETTEKTTKASGKKKPVNVSELSGDYFWLYDYAYGNRFRFPITDGLDFLIEEQLFQNQHYAEQNGGVLNHPGTRAIEFKDGSFAYSCGIPGNLKDTYSGKFSVEGNRILFDYEQFYRKPRNDDEYTIDINAVPEPYDLEKIKKGTEEEKKAELEKSKLRLSYDSMVELDEHGYFFSRFAPPICYSDKIRDHGFLPFVYASANGNALTPSYLYQFGDLLGFETYGMSLDGDYVPGESFTLDFDQMNVFAEDPYGYCSNVKNSHEDIERFIDNKSESIEQQYGLDESENLNTVLTFNNGSWKWKNAEGGLINNGSYQESELYPGLIVMYTDSTSRKTKEQLKLFEGDDTIMLYIDSDGQIYHPYFIKDHTIDVEATEKLRRNE